jgi:nitrogen fixation protein NifU and related proteins
MADPLEDIRNKLRGIYSVTTIDHIIRPHNAELFPAADGFASYGSGCGESMKICLKIREDRIENAGFWTDGCAATIACGSMATDMAKGRSVTQALSITARDIADALVDLPGGNLHCAELAAETLRRALKDTLANQQQPWKKLYRK